MNYAKSYIDNFRKYSAAVAAEKAARAALENDKFCQCLIDLAAVMDGKIVLADTIEE